MNLFLLFPCTVLAVLLFINNVFAQCKDFEFECPNNGTCLLKRSMCNGKLECPNGADETIQLCFNQNCTHTDFQCANGACIPLAFVCNFDFDCADKSDEANCPNVENIRTCSQNRTVSCLNEDKCIRLDQKCDGIMDCSDFSDEASFICNDRSCALNEFTCDNGLCIPKSASCDGTIDCADHSDEFNLDCNADKLKTHNYCGPNKFACRLGLCIDNEKVCDGVHDCRDGSDETAKQCMERSCNFNTHYRCAYGACIPKNKFNATVHCVDHSVQIINGQVIELYQQAQLNPQDDDAIVFPNDYNPLSSLINDYINDNKSCILPSFPENGKYNSDKQLLGSAGMKAPNGTILTYSCQEGYQLKSNKQIVCTNGHWNNNDYPSCISILGCPLFNSSEHSIYYNDFKATLVGTTQVDSGTVARVVCANGFEWKRYLYPPYTVIHCNKGKWSQPLEECIPECGTISKSRKGLLGAQWVIAGAVAKKSDFPWHSAVYNVKNNDHLQICGATIITDNILISAAHCFWNGNTNKLDKNFQNYKIGAGKFFRSWNSTDPQAQYRNVKRILIPTRYRASESNFANDIALIVLDEPLLLSNDIKPICIDWNTELNLQQPNSFGTIAGWGYTKEDGDPSEELRTAKLPFVDFNSCFDQSPPEFRPFITNDKFCAGSNNGTNVCLGDSGGGITFKRGDRHFLQGIVSIAPAKRNGCDAFKYVTFTDINNHLKWMKSIISLFNGNSFF